MKVYQFTIAVVLLFLVFFLRLLLQNSLPNFLIPDLFLIAVLFFGMQKGRLSGFFVGCVLGFIDDIFVNDPYFLNMIIIAILGYVSGFLKKFAYNISSLIVFFVVFGIYIIDNTIYILWIKILYDWTDGGNSIFILMLLTKGFLTSSLAAFFFQVFSKFIRE